MAANSYIRGLASFGKRFVSQIHTGGPSDLTPAGALSIRRAVHVSVYDKNPDDQIRSTVVPEEVIQPLSDKYWAPNPKTGVFGPATDQNPAEHGFYSAHADASTGDSVLEQKTFFRPLEDLDKPEPHP